MKNNEDRKNREEKGKKLDISISNQDLYHSFIPCLVIAFTSFVIRLKALILCTSLKEFTFEKNLWHLQGRVYKAKLIMYRTSIRKCLQSVQKCYKQGVLRNFTKFIRKHVCRSVLFNTVVSLHPAALLKRTLRHRCL